MESAEERPLFEYLSHVNSMGQDEIREVDDATFQRLSDLARSKASIEEYTALAGELIHEVNQVESSLNPVLTFLLNPRDPGRVRPAVLGLMTSAKIDMFRRMIDHDWVDGKLLLSHLVAMSKFRNQLAHSLWEGTRFNDEGLLEEGPFLSGLKYVKETGWTTVDQKILAEEMQEKILQARVLSTVLNELLEIRARSEFSGEALPGNISLGAVVVLGSRRYSPTPTQAWYRMLMQMFPFDLVKLARLVQPTTTPTQNESP